MRSRRPCCNSGNKAGALLAKRLQDNNIHSGAFSLRDGKGIVTYNLKDIVKIIANYYTSTLLYYMQESRMPHLSVPLNHHVMLEEIEEAIKSLPNYKAPGLDGFPYFFFTTFTSLLSLHLVIL